MGTAIANSEMTDPTCVLADPRLPSPAPEILDCLARQPGARGTIEDIQWLVLDARKRHWVPKISKTVAWLVERSFLEEKPSSDGKIFYRISPGYLSTFQQQRPDDDE